MKLLFQKIQNKYYMLKFITKKAARNFLQNQIFKITSNLSVFVHIFEKKN